MWKYVYEDGKGFEAEPHTVTHPSGVYFLFGTKRKADEARVFLNEHCADVNLV